MGIMTFYHPNKKLENKILVVFVIWYWLKKSQILILSFAKRDEKGKSIKTWQLEEARASQTQFLQNKMKKALSRNYI